MDTHTLTLRSDKFATAIWVTRFSLILIKLPISIFQISKFLPVQQKSRIRETLNLSTDADHRTDIFFGGGMVKKNKIKIKNNI